MALEDPEDEGQPSPRRRPGYRFPNQEPRNTNPAITGTPDEGNPNAPLKYDLKAIEARRQEMGEKIWRAVASGQLNLSNQGQLQNFLSSIGLLDKKEEGRHMRNMFLGGLGEEGWGMGDNGYSRALDEYRPNWSRMVGGMNKNNATGLYGTDGGKWYDAFGRLVRTDPVAPTTPVSTPTTTPTTASPPATNTSPDPNTAARPTPNAAFYGGTTAPSPYGVGGPNTRMTQQQVTANRNRTGARTTSQQTTPAWYSTWRF